MRFLAKEFFDRILYCRNPGGTANQNDLVDFFRAEAGIRHCLTGWSHGGFDQVGGQFIELGPGEAEVKMLGTAGIRRDERQVDVGSQQRRQFDFRLFRRFFQALQRHFIIAQINAGIFFELADQPVYHPLVEIIAAQSAVAAGGFYFKHAITQFEDRNVERAAAEVEHKDGVVIAFVNAIGQRSGCRFVDDPQHFQAGDRAGVFGCLTLAVAEISRYGDDCLRHLLAQIGFGVGLEFLQYHRRDFLRRIFFIIDSYRIIAAHFPFNRADRPVRVGNRLSFGHLADQALA